jgi:nitrite reductase/ring-hydroxylating ferredoxin subunit/uncharacterized membrane protein
MRSDPIDLMTTAPGVGPVAETLATAVRKAYEAGGDAGAQVKSALNGVWLGHPLHPVLTDVPLGAWTTAVACDALDTATNRNDLSGCARAAVTVGLAGAVAAAVAGLTDWSDTDGHARRVGLVHGVLNLAATGLFATSLVARSREPRGGRGWALAGYVVAVGAAYLGGDLVYGEQIGVNHAAGQEVPEEFTTVLALADLPDRQPTRVMVGTTPVLLVRAGETVRAIAETCSHLGGPLSEGTVTSDGTVVCPWHGSCFALDDGHVVNGPATHAQPWFEVRVRAGQIEVRMPQRGDEPASAPRSGNWRAAS